MPNYNLKVIKFFKPAFLLSVIIAVVMGGFLVSQKNSSQYKGNALAAECSNEFVDTFSSSTDFSKILSGSRQNTTVNGEYYTTNGADTAEIGNGNSGVRLRNFYDSMSPSDRHGGTDYSDQWGIGAYIDPDGNGIKVKKNGNSFYTSADLITETLPGKIQQTRLGADVLAKQDYVFSGQDDNNGGSLRLFGKRYQVLTSGQDLVIPLGAGHSFPAGSASQGSFTYSSEWKINQVLNTTIGPQVEGSSSSEPFDVDNDGKIDSNKAPYSSHIGFGRGDADTNTQYSYDTNSSGLVLKDVPGTVNKITPSVALGVWNKNIVEFVDPDNNGTGSANFKYSSSVNSGSKQTNVLTNWNAVKGIGGLGALTDGRNIAQYSIQVRKVKVDWAFSGQIESANITKPAGGNFQMFSAISTLPKGTNIKFQIINASNGSIFRDNITINTDLNIPGVPDTIRLRAILSRGNVLTATPVLNSWRIGCGAPTPPPVVGVCSSEYIGSTPGVNSFTLDPESGPIDIKLASSTNYTGPVSFDFYESVENLQAGPRLKTVGATMTSGLASIPVSYADLLGLNKKKYKINGMFASSIADPACIVTVNITIKPIINPNPNPLIGLPSIDCSLKSDPYKLKFYVSTYSYENQISLNKVFLLPKGSQGQTLDINYSGQSIVVDTSTPKGNLPNFGASYDFTRKLVAGQYYYWDFTISFDKNSPSPNYETFYNKGEFDLYVLIKDSANTADNSIGGRIQKATLSTNVDPLQNCTSIFYKTNGGDVRSNEKAYYENGVNITADSYSTNKIWKVVQQDSNYISQKNANSDLSQFISTFSAEVAPDAESCGSSSLSTFFDLNKDFCTNIDDSSSSIKQNIVMDEFAANLNDAVDNRETINKADTKTSTMSSSANIAYPSDAIKMLNATTLTIDIGSIPASYSPLLVNVTDANTVVVTDDVSPDKIKDLIIWCSTPSCTIIINGIKNNPSSGISSSTNKLTYPIDPIVTDKYISDNGRLYFNYGLVPEVPTIPSTVSTFANLKRIGSTSYSLIPNPRRILLNTNNPNTNESSLYLGGFMTNGYVYSDQSKGTNIIKGFVIARGLALRENSVNAPNTIDQNRNKFAYFRDYPNPFLYIDYDAKYMFSYRTLFLKSAGDVKREYIGL